MGDGNHKSINAGFKKLGRNYGKRTRRISRAEDKFSYLFRCRRSKIGQRRRNGREMTGMTKVVRKCRRYISTEVSDLVIEVV